MARSSVRRGAAWQLLMCLVASVAIATAFPHLVVAASGRQATLDAAPPTFQAELQQGRLHARAGDFDGAERIFSVLVTEHPQSAEAHYNLGLAILGRSGNKEGSTRAKIEIQRALQLQPVFPGAENVLGMLLLDNGDLAGALDYLRRAVAEDGTSAEIHFNLGRILSQSVETAGEAEYRQAILIRPHYPEAQVALGEVLLRSGRVAEAKTKFVAALRDNPDLETAHFGLGRVLKSAGDSKGAEIEFAEAKALLQRRADAVLSSRLSNAALDLAKQGSQKEAVAEARKAVSLAPDNGAAVFNLGLILADSGDFPAALLQVRKATSLLPMNSTAKDTLRKLQTITHLQHPASDLPLQDDVAGHMPPQPLAVNEQSNNFEDPVAWASELVRKQDLLGAVGELLYAIRQQPAHTALRLELVAVMLQQQCWQGAELEAYKVIQVAPLEWRAHLYLAEALSNEAGHPDVEAELHEVLHLDPGNRKAALLLQQISNKTEHLSTH